MANDLNLKMEAFSRLLKIMDELREKYPCIESKPLKA